MSQRDNPASEPTDFIRTLIRDDLVAGKNDGRVVTRFPPEPNGYLHIGHAKSICLNFGIAGEFPGAVCHLRFDDTNPSTEDPEYVESIQRDIRWLGFDWEERRFFASDYFEIFYRHAVYLIERGLAYVCSLSEEEIRAYRGTVTEAGRNSPDRDRPVAENLDLLERMRAGEFADGTYTVRAKIDMASANMKMRDPLLYRIRHVDHYRTGDAWPIYPMYDFAHCLSDEQEGITHSLCTLEFENNRDIYDWVLDHVQTTYRPVQIEFARLNISFTVLSKRKLLELVQGGYVEGWDDPRMPTLSGYRRRGYTPEAIRAFCDRIGVAKSNSTVDVAQLEHAIRDDLNPKVKRVLTVLDPLRVVIVNYPEEGEEALEAPYFPHDVPGDETRPLPFSRELWIERTDFAEDPPKGFHRLAPGREVRLRYAYFIRCEEVVKDPETGEVVELRCTYDPATRGGAAPDGRKVKGTIHWVSAHHAQGIEVRLYDRLFTIERPDLAEEDFKAYLNPHSLVVHDRAKAEPSLATAEPGERFQFERHGYFYLEPESTTDERRVFNRIVSLRDSWAKKTAAPQATERTSKEERKPPTAPAPPVERVWSDEQRAALERYRRAFGLPDGIAEVLTAEPIAGRLFERAIAAHDAPLPIANWIVNEALRVVKERGEEDLPFGGAEIGELVARIEDSTLSGRAAKEVFAAMAAGEGRPDAIIETKGLGQIADEGTLGKVVDEVLAAHPKEVAEYRAGKTALFGFFIGQVMQKTGGAANPALTRALLERALSPS
ncbi:MAG: glutamine--tRNA ligase/YqeY domain fusion protein [Acidobacteriota bacterium]